MTQGQFKHINSKLDSILESSLATSNYEFMLKSHRATVETLTKENVKVLEDLTKEIKASEKAIADTTE